MGNERKLRLIQVAKEFKVGLNTVTDFLQKRSQTPDDTTGPNDTTTDTPTDGSIPALLAPLPKPRMMKSVLALDWSCDTRRLGTAD